MFEKQGHVVNAFGLYLGLSGAGSDSGPDGSDGGGLVVKETVVRDLNAAQEVVHRLVRVLLKAKIETSIENLCLTALTSRYTYIEYIKRLPTHPNLAKAHFT